MFDQKWPQIYFVRRVQYSENIDQGAEVDFGRRRKAADFPVATNTTFQLDQHANIKINI